MLDVRPFYASSNPQVNYATGTITITSTGRTVAKHVRIERALLSSNSREPHTRQDEAIASIAEWHTFPPGSQVVRFKIPVLLSHGTFDRTDPQLTTSVTTVYNDGVSVRDTVNDATWCAVKLQQPTIDFLRFYSALITLMKSMTTTIKVALSLSGTILFSLHQLLSGV
jgi:hypothetical protein